MHLPQERGPISRHVIQALSREGGGLPAPAFGPGEVTGDADVQLALWMIYELHYRGFEGVPDDREWDPELLSLRRCAESFAALMNKPLKTRGAESPDALISNGQLGQRLFGYPRVPIQQLISWIAQWVMSGGASLGKPTHFEARDGKY